MKREARFGLLKAEKFLLVMEKRAAEEKERLETNKLKLNAIGSVNVGERMLHWLHVCRGLVNCHGQDFVASVGRWDAELNSVSTSFLLWIIRVQFLDLVKRRVASLLRRVPSRNINASKRCFCSVGGNCVCIGGACVVVRKKFYASSPTGNRMSRNDAPCVAQQLQKSCLKLNA